jgi:hypothetical protein
MDHSGGGDPDTVVTAFFGLFPGLTKEETK